MVTFSCEDCGDVLAKKKLDKHRERCSASAFTCLDCMEVFHDRAYQAHTSCISEAQKYQGAMYNPKDSRKTRASRRNSLKTDSMALTKHRQPTVEDEYENSQALAIVDPPPECPSPPPPGSAYPITPIAPVPRLAQVNVFDFQVENTPGPTPNASTLNVPMTMKSGAMMLFDPTRKPSPVQDEMEATLAALPEDDDARTIRQESRPEYSYTTPAPRHVESQPFSTGGDDTASKKDKKRKWVQDIDTARSRSIDGDSMMIDAPTLHTGLTGGLNKLLRRTNDYPSPSYSIIAEPDIDMERDRRSISPIKRTKTDDSEIMDSSRQRRHHRRTSRDHRASSQTEKERRDKKKARRESKRLEPPPALKQIEYHPPTDPLTHLSTPPSASGSQALVHQPTGESQMVLYDTEGTSVAPRARTFLSMVTKGTDSERGCSLNKVLKRYHRTRCGSGRGGDIAEKDLEEKNLWKEIRMKKNERGEIVLFF